MPRFSVLIDVPLIVLVFVATLWMAWYWVYSTDQDSVPKTRASASKIAFRILVIVTAVGGLCYLIGIAFWLLLLVVAFLVVCAFTGEDVLGVVALPFLVLGYLAKEYVLGFPESVLRPKKDDPDSGSEREQEMIGRQAITTSPLRPQGNLMIDGQTFAAASECGSMIDSGVAVEVVGVRNGSLLVTAVEEATESLEAES